MPKIYTDENLRKVYVALRDQDMSRGQVAKALDISPEEVDSMYDAARKRFSYGATRNNYVKKKGLLPSNQDSIPKLFERPKAVYSNRNIFEEYEKLEL